MVKEKNCIETEDAYKLIKKYPEFKCKAIKYSPYGYSAKTVKKILDKYYQKKNHY